MHADISSILRLNGWAGRIVLAFYGLGTGVIAVLNLGGLTSPAVGLLTLGLLWLGLAALGLPRGEPLGLPFTMAIVAVVLVATALSSGNVAEPLGPGFANWPLGAMTFLLFVLALRGRRGWAWIGFAVLAMVSVAVTIVMGRDVAPVVNDVLRQAATLVIGTLFAVVLRRATRTIEAIQASQVRLVGIAAAAAVATDESAAEAARLEREVRPALERVIDPSPFTEPELRAFAEIESSVRLGTRPERPSGDRLVDAARAASNRGVEIQVFDDRAVELEPAVRRQLDEAIIPLLDNRLVTSVLVRLSPVGSGEVATVVVQEAGVYRRVVVPEETQLAGGAPTR